MALIRIGISSCVVGGKVRFDGGQAKMPTFLKSIANDIEFVPFCPEVAAGMSVPRETVRLIGFENALASNRLYTGVNAALGNHFGKFGYVSALRKGGFGDLDIYRVNFNEIEPKYSVISGVISPGDDKKFEDVFIQITDKETDEIFGDYIPNQLTNRFVIILPQGKYNMFVGAIGYEEQYHEIEILDKTSFKAFIDFDIKMKPTE